MDPKRERSELERGSAPDESEPLPAHERLCREVLAWIAARAEGGPVAALLEGLRIARAQYTGAGWYFDLAPSPQVAPLTDEESGRWLDGRTLAGPEIRAADFEGGGGSVLFFGRGRPTELELYAYLDRFPQALEHWRLEG